MLEEQIDSVAILDYGGQYTHLIAKRVRGLGIYSRILPPEGFDPAADPTVKAVILSGSPSSIYEPGAPGLSFDPLSADVPILGLCYGHQLLAATVGGQVQGGGLGEYGVATARCDTGSSMFHGLDGVQRVWMSHRDKVTQLPPGYRVTSSSDGLPIAAFESPDRRIFGLQFHPEVHHTAHGDAILDNFLAISGAKRDWNAASYAQLLEDQTRRAAEGKKLFLLVSGGVDSLVALALCLRAVGTDRLQCLHVDTGFMRLDESRQVVAALADLGLRHLELAQAEPRFLSALEGVTDPEEKRHIIGRLFVEEVQDRLGGLGLGDDWLLVQGTIYPDSIESGATAKAAVIKTHHNRVPEIERLIRSGKVIEPLLDLYKHEVRQLGSELQLPAELVARHPFPGPGLAIRYLCSDSDQPEQGFNVENAELQALAASYGLGAALLPLRSVGVQGDARSYRHPALLWTVQGPRCDWERLHACASEVVNRLDSLNRAVYWPGQGQPPRLRLNRASIDRSAMDRLRQADHEAHRLTAGCAQIWQMPVVALPLFDPQGQQAFVLRPVTSRDAMTADFYRMDAALLDQVASAVAAIPGAGPLLYDITTKPPGTIEWE